MYHPYFRGKQYELITIRETAHLLAQANFVPVIEPVREQMSGMKKTLDALCEAGARAIVIINPQFGDHRHDGSNIVEFIGEHFEEQDNLVFGLLLTEEISTADAMNLCTAHPHKELALVHAGFSNARELSRQVAPLPQVTTSVFLEDYCGKLYQRHFGTHTHRVLIRNGFQRRRNRDHPDAAEFFSDLHATYELENATGFGDYLIVGDEYLEGGGPAYTIAIHLTFIDNEKDDEMHIMHFKSDRQDTPKDPAGKFAEALEKLMAAIDARDSKFADTEAIAEFRDLHARGHYPGLGYLKKLSMKHHIETLADYFSDAEPQE